MHAVLCPVCNGRGIRPEPSKSTVTWAEACNGCGGKGWVTVPEDPKEDIYAIPYIGTGASIVIDWRPWGWCW